MDVDSSTKFIGSLTKFLQSLCNGYVEFQRGVELVGHIYLSIDTGEKVDYVLHEKVCKSDENSVTFVSNSFHAQPLDKKTDKKDSSNKPGASPTKASKDTSDDDSDDIMIVDHSKGVPGSTNSGTIPSRGLKRVASPGAEQRQAQRARGLAGLPAAHSQGSSSSGRPVGSPLRGPGGRQQTGGPSATVTSQDVGQQDNLSMVDLKLEQITRDELLSLASQVGDGGSGPSHSTPSSAPRPLTQRPGPSGGSGDPPTWIKQEVADDNRTGESDAGWSHGRDDSNSNSGSNLYPVMLHQNAGAYSNPVFPGSSAPSMYANPLPGTSQDMSGLDPSGIGRSGQPMRVVPDWKDDFESEEFAHMMYQVSAPARRHLLPLALRVDLIKQSSSKSQRQLAAAFGISKTQVFAILKKKEEILKIYEQMKHMEGLPFAELSA